MTDLAILIGPTGKTGIQSKKCAADTIDTLCEIMTSPEFSNWRKFVFYVTDRKSGAIRKIELFRCTDNLDANGETFARVIDWIIGLSGDSGTADVIRTIATTPKD